MRITLSRVPDCGCARRSGLGGPRASGERRGTPPDTGRQLRRAQKPAQPPATPDQPIFRAGINTVRVDVIVTDSQGNPSPT